MVKRTVTYAGSTYKVRSDTVEIPDLANMERLDALIWLNRNTYARGYSRPQPGHELSGLGVTLTVRS